MQQTEPAVGCSTFLDLRPVLLKREPSSYVTVLSRHKGQSHTVRGGLLYYSYYHYSQSIQWEQWLQSTPVYHQMVDMSYTWLIRSTSCWWCLVCNLLSIRGGHALDLECLLGASLSVPEESEEGKCQLGGEQRKCHPHCHLHQEEEVLGHVILHSNWNAGWWRWQGQ